MDIVRNSCSIVSVFITKHIKFAFVYLRFGAKIPEVLLNASRRIEKLLRGFGKSDVTLHSVRI